MSLPVTLLVSALYSWLTGWTNANLEALCHHAHYFIFQQFLVFWFLDTIVVQSQVVLPGLSWKRAASPREFVFSNFVPGPCHILLHISVWTVMLLSFVCLFESVWKIEPCFTALCVLCLPLLQPLDFCLFLSLTHTRTNVMFDVTLFSFKTAQSWTM